MAIGVLDVCLAGLAIYLVKHLVSKRRLPLPPGPPGWPLIGNLLDLPTYAPYKTFAVMGRTYGPIVLLQALGKRYIVLNSIQAAHDLLEKKSATSSNRAHSTMGGELVGCDPSMIFLQYGETYRKQRKIFHKEIGTKKSLGAFYPIEEAEMKRFICNVLKNPGNLVAHSRRMAGSVILKISHGYSVEKDDDPLLEVADKAMRILTVVKMPGKFLVDTFPILRYWPEWLPGGGFHKLANQWRKIVSAAVNTPHQFVLEHLEKGDAVPSFTSRVLQEGLTLEEEEILKWASVSMYLGGSDTTPSAISAFFLAMTLYPNVFKKAQAEVDAVIGNDRLATMQDRDALPYLNAICMELLRWNVVAPLTRHVTTQDEVYNGYAIPKGTHLLGNMWSMLTDPSVYPDPDVFDPERFLGEKPQLDPREVCFGWGRRACPGMRLAELSIFTCAAMALATLNISRCVENGVEKVPRYEVQEGIIRHVKPFECRIVARSKKAEDLLEAS